LLSRNYVAYEINFKGREIDMEIETGTRDFCGKLIGLVMVVVLLVFANVGLAADEGVHHYKMISAVEYKGGGEFRNQVEELFTVRTEPLSNEEVQYFISTEGLFEELSFVVDKGTGHLSQTGEAEGIWAQINNHCAESLRKVTTADIGRTWKQAFDFSSIDKSLPAELKFTLTAIKVENQELGEMIAVRALSEPFFIKQGAVMSKINSLYVFDPEIENIFLSVSVFESVTTMNGLKETLSHKVATCKTDAEGNPVNLKGLGEKFESFVAKLALTEDIKVVKASALPDWAKNDGLRAAQVSCICSSLACEGALNPVVTVSMPTAKVIELQKNGSDVITVNSQLAAVGSVPVVGPWEWLVNKVGFWPAVGVVGAAVAVPVAASGGGGGGSSGGAATPPASP
jgi:hypothetical protein